MNSEKMGEWAFLLGVFIAIVVGVLSPWVQSIQGILMAVLALVGLVVGLLNIKEKEVNSFLLAALVLIVSASAIGTAFALLGESVTGAVVGFVTALTAFVAPAAVVVALKSVYNLAATK
ncbi:hypothetical protein HYT84_02580 [Candidatus Micrarchaeota archaeon]|nr:hypothetical protein [Candidatus Micrarchaeota archaeon]